MQSGSLLFLYMVQQTYIQYEMQQLIYTKNSTHYTFVLSKNEFEENSINENEILLNGSLYDIISLKITGDKIEIVAFHDEEEEIVLLSIKAAIDNNSGENKSLPNPITRMITMIFISPDIFYSPVLTITKQLSYIDFSIAVSTVKSETASPPPWFI